MGVNTAWPNGFWGGPGSLCTPLQTQSEGERERVAHRDETVAPRDSSYTCARACARACDSAGAYARACTRACARACTRDYSCSCLRLCECARGLGSVMSEISFMIRRNNLTESDV